MILVDTFSVVIGSVIILTLLGSIAVDGIRRKVTNKRKIVPTINNKWQKVEVQVQSLFSYLKKQSESMLLTPAASSTTKYGVTEIIIKVRIRGLVYPLLRALTYFTFRSIIFEQVTVPANFRTQLQNFDNTRLFSILYRNLDRQLFRIFLLHFVYLLP